MEHIETEVLVVGAGLAGASAALMLARHGVRTLAVSRGHWVADSPRAHIVNQRTMEVLRSLDLESVCADAAVPGELMANHPMMTSLTGREFGRLWTWGNDPVRQDEYGAASPVTGCDLPQDRFEPILISEALRLGAVVRFRTEFVSLEQDDDGVTTTLRDLVTNSEFTVRSKYVVGADGGQSPVAEAVGLPFEGTPGIGPALNIHFRADLSRFIEDRPGSIFWILQPDREGAMGNAMLRMVRPWSEWIVGFVHLGESIRGASEDELIGLVHEIIGDDSVPIEIIGSYPWRINHVIAQEYSRGRVMCAGDAVHRHPPMNGLGGNTCIQDAFGLAWKLAAVLRWGAGPRLLETYSAERQPVGRTVVDRAVAGWRQNPEVIRSLGIDPAASPVERQAQFDVLFEDSEEGEQRRSDFERAKRSKEYSYHAHGTEMNQHYASSAIIEDEGLEPLAHRDADLHFTMTSRPGSRVPHAWVAQSGRTISVLDLCRPEQFTLLARNRGAEWIAAAQKVGERLGVPLVAVRIGPGCEVEDLYGVWRDVSEIGEGGALLVRPDQHVAWRNAIMASDPEVELERALRQILSM
ncbi:FAD-dependent monooxygenase [Leucobacter rhizosphaerae]|uniref:FAD-dependent monooxygenase n=1 Tax=Leucobacter rhizosphaerae TaxID=2932245 RepID=A0ABY4FTW3_9MICO|nr:FAD-dependent monooxygenase [Leucobacter rhizosphaerae]UOQ59700.1 FAD-dependent monooxygenase [Leucobacter rhizosphaerae]